MNPDAQAEATKLLDNGAVESNPEFESRREEVQTFLQGNYNTAPASRPTNTIIIPPPSDAAFQDPLRFDLEEEEGNSDKTPSPTDSEAVREYEVVVEDEFGVHTVARRPLKSLRDSVGAIWRRNPRRCVEQGAIDCTWADKTIVFLHSSRPGSKTRLEYLYGRLPPTGSPPLQPINENEGRRQLNGEILDDKSQRANPQPTPPTGSAVTNDSTEWLDEWQRGKAEVLERLRVLHETGNRRMSYCTRIM